MNTLQVLKYGIGLTLDGYRQLSFINSYLKPLVNRHCERINYKLTASEEKKVLFYYPMYAVLGCAEMYTALKGRGLTMEERKRVTLVAAWATLCDDLVDDHNWSRDEVFEILFENVDEKKYDGNVQLLIAINKELYKCWNVSENYIKQLKIALEWQSVSARQSDPNITLDEIVTICREKNGNTSLMFATLLDESWTKNELDFIYQSAIVGQLTNDAFDIFSDSKNGIRTYINSAPSIIQARDFFLTECRKLHSLVRACNTSEKNKRATIRRMSILHAFTLTALEHLQNTENKSGGHVDWTTVSRKDSVTDMALNKNRFKTIRYMNWLAEQ